MNLLPEDDNNPGQGLSTADRSTSKQFNPLDESQVGSAPDQG